MSQAGSTIIGPALRRTAKNDRRPAPFSTWGTHAYTSQCGRRLRRPGPHRPTATRLGPVRRSELERHRLRPGGGGPRSSGRRRRDGSEAARAWRKGYHPIGEAVELPEGAFRNVSDKQAYGV